MTGPELRSMRLLGEMEATPVGVDIVTGADMGRAVAAANDADAGLECGRTLKCTATLGTGAEYSRPAALARAWRTGAGATGVASWESGDGCGVMTSGDGVGATT